jgi:hypothetical protein
MTHNIMTLIILTFNIITLNIMPPCMVTHHTMTCNIMTPSRTFIFVETSCLSLG